MSIFPHKFSLFFFFLLKERSQGMPTVYSEYDHFFLFCRTTVNWEYWHLYCGVVHDWSDSSLPLFLLLYWKSTFVTNMEAWEFNTQFLLILRDVSLNFAFHKQSECINNPRKWTQKGDVGWLKQILLKNWTNINGTLSLTSLSPSVSSAHIPLCWAWLVIHPGNKRAKNERIKKEAENWLKDNGSII